MLFMDDSDNNENSVDIVYVDSFDDNYDIEEPRNMRYLPIHIAAFMIPFILTMASFAAIGLYPFGTRQIMVIDSWHQYYPFLQELHDKLINGGSLLFSWNGGAGTNFLTLMAYYASSPLYLLSVFFPREYLREFMMIITAVKIGFAGLFFSIYLRGTYSRYIKLKHNRCTASIGFAIVGFSVLYALCAYVAGYYWCIFFLNSVALLPLIILGLERLIDSGKFKLYTISLGIAVFANYYTAMFVCFFIAIYYFVLYFTKLDEKFSFRALVKKTLEVVAASLIGVGLAAVILLPTILWFPYTGNYGSSFGRDVNTYNSLMDIFTNLLSGGVPNIREMPPAGRPNIAVGVMSIIFAGLYFINKNIKIRNRLIFGGFIIFLALSFNLNILDYIWHGGHFPNEIPFRQSFVFSFVLASIAFQSYMAFKSSEKSVPLKTLAIFGAGFFAYLFIAERIYQGTGTFGFEVFYISGALLAVYLLILVMFKYKRLSASIVAVFLMFIMMFEGGLSIFRGVVTAGSSDRASYPMFAEAVSSALDYIDARDTNSGLYRIEMAQWWGTNDPMLYGYRGVSQFSSKANGRFTHMLRHLGINAHPGGNKFLYSSATPVANMFLSVRYLLTRNNHSSLNSIAFDEIYRHYADRFVIYPDVIAYENRYWLPIAFMVDESINNVNLDVSNPFIVQNDIMRRAARIRQDVFRSIQSRQNGHVNVTVTPSAEHGIYHFTTTGSRATVNKRFVIPERQQVYLYLRNPWHGGNKNATVRVLRPNGERLHDDILAEADAGLTIDAGIVPAGGTVEISFEVQSGSAHFYLYAVTFDADVFREGFDILSESVLNVHEFSDTRINGTITVYEYGGLFFASIPFDRGWRIRVNGESRAINPLSEQELIDAAIAREWGETTRVDRREVRTMRDGFITIPLEVGTHEIELYYITHGLIPGIIISLVSVMLIVVWSVVVYVRKKRICMET